MNHERITSVTRQVRPRVLGVIFKDVSLHSGSLRALEGIACTMAAWVA